MRDKYMSIKYSRSFLYYLQAYIQLLHVYWMHYYDWEYWTQAIAKSFSLKICNMLINKLKHDTFNATYR